MSTQILTSDRGIFYAHPDRGQPDELPHRTVYVQRGWEGDRETYWRAQVVYVRNQRDLELLVAEWNAEGEAMKADADGKWWSYEIPYEPEEVLVGSKILCFIWGSQKKRSQGLHIGEVFGHPQLVQHGELLAAALDGLMRHGYVHYETDELGMGRYCSKMRHYDEVSS